VAHWAARIGGRYMGAARATDAPITCQPLFWGSGVKTAGTTLMSHSMLEDRLL